MRKIINLHLIAVMALGAGIFASRFAGASPVFTILGPAPLTSEVQTNFAGPSGQWTNTVSGPTNAVWDVTPVYGLNSVSATLFETFKVPYTTIKVTTNVSGSGTTNYVTNLVHHVTSSEANRAYIRYQIAPQQDGAGRFSGTGSNTVTFNYLDQMSNSWVAVPAFPGVYQVSGSIRSSRGVTRGSFATSVSGLGLMRGTERLIRSTTVIGLTFLNYSNIALVTHSDSVSASGEGSISSHGSYLPSPLSDMKAGNGTWTLNMTLSTTGKVITGSAVVTLNSGRTFQFLVNKGAYKSTTQQSLLVLTGSDTSKGSVLQVKMNADAVASIKGRISGQMVGITF